MKDDKNKRGFLGLSALASDTDELKKKAASLNASAKKYAVERIRKNQRQSKARDSRPNPAPPQQPETDKIISGASRSSKPEVSVITVLWWLFVGVSALIWLVAIVNDVNGGSNTDTTYSQSSSSSNNLASQSTETRTLEFSKPLVGASDVFSVAQIRWCLREAIRIDALRSMAATNSQIDIFNGTVNDYNRRCGSYRYRPGSLARAQRDVNRMKTQIIENASFFQ